MSPWRAAIDQAMLLHRQPGFAVGFRQAALPDGMAFLIRLASDEGSRRKDLAQLLECDEDHLQKVAANYLLTVCLFPGSDDLRALGLNSAADMSAAKEHHRLLLKWLHPDRNPENQAYAERVNQAWAALKNAAKINPVPSPLHARPALDVEAQAPPSGKFPLFLWGLAGLVVLLLAISALPDAEVYVANADYDASTNGENVDTQNAIGDQDGQIESRLKALGLSFGEQQSKPPAQPSIAKTEKNKQSSKAQANIKLAPSSKPDNASAQIKTTSQRLVIKSKNEPTGYDDKPGQDIKAASSASPGIIKGADPISSAIVPEQAVAPSHNLQVEGQALVAEFRQRYKQGNSGSFMQMFGISATNNRGDRKAIEADYARLFINTSSRKIDFTQSKWIFREDVIQFKAVYEASVRRKGDILPVTSKGRIDLIMSLENDALRIQQILLSE